MGWLRAWLARRRLRRRAERLLADALRDPAIHATSSFRARHTSRTVILDIVVGADSDGEIREIHFGIVRHPRPHRFTPRQHDEVIELCVYSVAERCVRVVRGIRRSDE